MQHTVEELDGTDSVAVFCGLHWGQRDFEFFGLKIARTQRPWVPLSSIIRGPGRMHVTFLRVRKFALLEKSTIFVKILEFFAGKWAKVESPKFHHIRPLAVPV